MAPPSESPPPTDVGGPIAALWRDLVVMVPSGLVASLDRDGRGRPCLMVRVDGVSGASRVVVGAYRGRGVSWFYLGPVRVAGCLGGMWPIAPVDDLKCATKRLVAAFDAARERERLSGSQRGGR